MPRMPGVYEGGLQLMAVSTVILLVEHAIVGLVVGWIGRGLWDEWKWDKP